MDDSKDTPKVFANRMIRMLVDNSLGSDTNIPPNDYLVMRVAFRNMGGTWEQISQGNHEHLAKLKQVINTWTQQHQKKPENQRLI